jgi:hypothetical protein
MSINLSVRNFVLTIAGLNCSQACIAWTGADEKIDPTRGLISFTGEIELHRPVGFESLDDRRNPRWARGQEIILAVANKAGTLLPPPRGGKLYILESEYDLETRRLQIRTGDEFALKNNQQPKGDRSKICLGTNVSKTQIINNLLQAACISPLIDAVPGNLNAPSPRLLEGSYLEQAGAIAASEGYFLYKDSLGQTRAKSVNISPPIAAQTVDLTTQAAIYKRMYGQQPAQRLIVSGKYTLVEPTGDFTTTYSYELAPAATIGAEGGNIIIRERWTTDRFNREAKTRTVETTVKEPAALIDPVRYEGNFGRIYSEFQREKYQYETNAPIAAGSNSSHCEQGNQGRLLEYERRLQRTIIATIREVVESYDGAIGGILNLTDAEYEVIRYFYEPLPPDDEIDNETTEVIQQILSNGVRHERSLSRPVGVILPEEYSAGGDFPYIFSLDLKPVELETNRWREMRPREWQHRKNVLQAIAIAKPDVLEILRERNTNIDGKLGLVTTEDVLTISNNGNAQPPAADTYPPAFDTREIAVRGRAVLPVDAPVDSCSREYRRDLSFEYLSGLNQAEIQDKVNKLALIWGVMFWGQYKGAQVTTDLGDEWFDYSPLDRCDFVEPEGIASYLGDGFGFSLAGNRCAIDIDGVFLGFANNPATPAVITPIYQTRLPVQLANGVAIATRYRDYDNSAVRLLSQLGHGSAIRDAIKEGVRLGHGSAIRVSDRRISLRLANGFAAEVTYPIEWNEVTQQQWGEMSDRQWRKII